MKLMYATARSGERYVLLPVNSDDITTIAQVCAKFDVSDPCRLYELVKPEDVSATKELLLQTSTDEWLDGADARTRLGLKGKKVVTPAAVVAAAGAGAKLFIQSTSSNRGVTLGMRIAVKLGVSSSSAAPAAASGKSGAAAAAAPTAKSRVRKATPQLEDEEEEEEEEEGEEKPAAKGAKAPPGKKAKSGAASSSSSSSLPSVSGYVFLSVTSADTIDALVSSEGVTGSMCYYQVSGNKKEDISAGKELILVLPSASALTDASAVRAKLGLGSGKVSVRGSDVTARCGEGALLFVQSSSRNRKLNEGTILAVKADGAARAAGAAKGKAKGAGKGKTKNGGDEEDDEEEEDAEKGAGDGEGDDEDGNKMLPQQAEEEGAAAAPAVPFAFGAPAALPSPFAAAGAVFGDGAFGAPAGPMSQSSPFAAGGGAFGAPAAPVSLSSPFAAHYSGAGAAPAAVPAVPTASEIASFGTAAMNSQQREEWIGAMKSNHTWTVVSSSDCAAAPLSMGDWAPAPTVPGPGVPLGGGLSAYALALPAFQWGALLSLEGDYDQLFPADSPWATCLAVDNIPQLSESEPVEASLQRPSLDMLAQVRALGFEQASEVPTDAAVAAFSSSSAPTPAREGWYRDLRLEQRIRTALLSQSASVLAPFGLSTTLRVRAHVHSSAPYSISVVALFLSDEDGVILVTRGSRFLLVASFVGRPVLLSTEFSYETSDVGPFVIADSARMQMDGEAEMDRGADADSVQSVIDKAEELFHLFTGNTPQAE